jgi:hypothetical protein
MSTRKRKQDEELVALPSDESEEEEEYVYPPLPLKGSNAAHEGPQLASLQLQSSLQVERNSCGARC